MKIKTISGFLLMSKSLVVRIPSFFYKFYSWNKPLTPTLNSLLSTVSTANAYAIYVTAVPSP